MKRSIAKILIQYFYDSHPMERSNSLEAVTNTNVADPLPRWLRNWTERDLQLAEFELELKQLESRLVSHADRHLENWDQAKDSLVFPSLANSTRAVHAHYWVKAPFLLGSLAAGLSCVLLAVGWSFWKSNSGLHKPDSIAKYEINETEPKHSETLPTLETVRREQLVRSTWEATKRLAADWRQKSGQANHTLASVNQQAMDHQIRELGGEVLRFVAQKLPQATVRMFGMSATRNGS